MLSCLLAACDDVPYVNSLVINGDTISFHTDTLAAAGCSGTLPIVVIHTEYNSPITDKETLIPAGLYIIIPDSLAEEPIGSFSQMVPLTIRGRGNASWLQEKKPYKIKFERSQSILEMPANKHFALLNGHGYSAWMGLMMGMETGRAANMPWVPRIKPVDLVVNGRYEGMYFLAETVRISPDRVNIYRQPDNCSDSKLMSAGWLVEIDNYPDEDQVEIKERGTLMLRATSHSPENLSAMQRDWLAREMATLNRAIYSRDPSGHAWSSLIDAHSVAQYFVVRELMHDTDAYNGSFYLNKNLGDDKWQFGPLWDIGTSGAMDNWVMYNHPDAANVHWIEALFYTEIFQTEFRNEWARLKEKLPEIYAYGRKLADVYAAADSVNAVRWPSMSDNTLGKYEYVHACMRSNEEWIDRWLVDNPDISAVVRRKQD